MCINQARRAPLVDSECEATAVLMLTSQVLETALGGQYERLYLGILPDTSTGDSYQVMMQFMPDCKT
jgi:hypothetical protein